MRDIVGEKTAPTKFLVFIAYDDATGFDLADHLKSTLEKRGIPSFVAKRDIPLFVRSRQGWREKIDRAIGSCNTLFLILSTDRLSREVIREVKQAFDRSKADTEFSIFICRIQGVPRSDQQLLAAGIDSKDYQQIDFTSQYDLVRKVGPLLDEEGRPKEGTESEEQKPKSKIPLAPKAVEKPESSIVCQTCGNTFAPRGLSNPVLHIETGGLVFADTLCPGCGEAVRFAAKDNTMGTFVISIAELLENSTMREIRVRLPSGEMASRQARFFTIGVGIPVGSENATNLKLLYRHPNSNELYELEKIPPNGTTSITVQWNRPEKFLPAVPDHFATAFLDGAKVKNFTLTAGLDYLNMSLFVLFFTIEGSDTLYFPSIVNQPAFVMPVKIRTEIYAEADKKPQTLLKRLEIQAQTWEKARVTEIRKHGGGASRDLAFVAEQIDLFYRIERDMLRIRIELIGIKHPIDILFPSWNETLDFERRDTLVGDDRKALERMSTAINGRNNRRKELLREGWNFMVRPADQDAEFLRRNQECLETYDRIRKEVLFLRNLPEIALSAQIRIDSAHLTKEDVPTAIEIRGRKVVREAAYFYFVSITNHFRKQMDHVTGDFVIGGKRTPFHFLLCPLKQEYSVAHPFGIVPQAPYDWEGREEFAIALLNSDKWRRPEITLNENDFGVTCALFFALEGADYFIVPSDSRRHIAIPGTYRVDLLLRGVDMPYHKAASFVIAAKGWNAFEVRRIADDSR